MSENLPSIQMTQYGLVPQTFEELWRYSTALSKSQLVTPDYNGKPENCLALLDLSVRLKKLK